ncbi:MAG: hypothetical protein E6970_01450 [Peptostreptococcus sp.]|uniref:hypothetical protein n=1 Tax=Peptostreptococcus TaxID=1257 RepID=UPI00232E780B|nr:MULTISPECIES: hypothetical protein [Peptostreptococcus]MDB8821745.1 hypothetical protein [Peptostreptococcus anaerobius]MDB8826374.1 hypothetical protein [Peptostreptococcus anaerobius]MDB8828214.1 hypothetical protein [Peptostreptococcus anaerobius]MDB8829960.1 hypothetical protein [Peptostreptococcus anaerobius]MDB8831851.1 hypothetical protein [Peptostreptococcus anaerobius]
MNYIQDIEELVYLMIELDIPSENIDMEIENSRIMLNNEYSQYVVESAFEEYKKYIN